MKNRKSGLCLGGRQHRRRHRSGPVPLRRIANQGWIDDLSQPNQHDGVPLHRQSRLFGFL